MLGIPVIYDQLVKIRESISQKPEISLGVANVNDLPLSNIRSLIELPYTTSIGQGYPCFWLVIRNSGQVAGRNIKIHLEYSTPIKQRTNIFSPVVNVGNWLNDNRFTFKKVNNADFVFISGLDWVLHANDTDMFDFAMTTSVIKQKRPVEIRERPSIGTYKFLCTLWADALDKPIVKELTIHIVPSIQPEEERIKVDFNNQG